MIREWRFRRIALLCALWIIFVLAVLIERSVAFARQVSREHPTDDLYVVLLHLPGGLWTLLGPPALLVVAWLIMLRVRPE